MGIDAEMFVRTKKRITSKQVKHAAWLLASVFGADSFWMFRGSDHEKHALEIVEKYEQDGPTIRPKEGETFIVVHIATRYWGPGYERGNLGLILGVAMWLEAHFPGCEVWYGGDSSGVCAKRLDAAAREKLVAHAASEHGADYRQSDERDGRKQTCGFCEEPMSICSWGPYGREGSICTGCGLHRYTERDGATTDAFGHWPGEKRAAS